MKALEPSQNPKAGIVGRHPKLTLALALLVGIALASVSQLFPKSTHVGYTPVVEGILDDAGLPTRSPNGAAVTLVVFSDYQCPICRANESALERLVERRDDVRLLYVDWPIFGPASTLAAQYALAANEQGRYVQMHRALMAARPPFTAQALDQVAASAGVDVPRLHRDLVADRLKIDVRLGKNRFDAWSLGLPGTPAYLTGPYLRVGRVSEGALSRMIDRASHEPPPQTQGS